MSSTTWTPTEVASKVFRCTATVWRAVEAQHLVATIPLVDTLEEQAELEDILEQSKPSIRKDARELHWLLFTPFRYQPFRSGSRFRAFTDAGVFYGAEEIRTACAELGYWRWRFLMESPDLPSLPARAQSIFSAAIAGTAIDLRASPFVRSRAIWTNPVDYSGCQQLANAARQSGVQIVCYESVRDPQHGQCIAVLEPQVFAQKSPLEIQSWLLTVTRTRVFWHRDSAIKQSAYEFDAALWQRALKLK